MQVTVSPLRFESLIFGDPSRANAAVVYLHGKGGFGKGATGQFEHADMATLLYQRNIRPALPVIIACALDGERYQMDSLIPYLDSLKQEYGLQQLHIIGYSRGGIAGYELAERNYALASITVINSPSPLPAGYYQCQGPLTAYPCPLHIVQCQQDERVDVHAVEAFAQDYPGELVYTRWHGDHYAIAEILADPSLWLWLINATATDPGLSVAPRTSAGPTAASNELP